MFRIERIAAWIFIVAMALLVPSMQFVNYIDEIVAVGLLSLAVIDSILNRGAWRRYRLLWIILAIMGFYAVYSMTVVHYNTKMAITIDILIESKPFIAFTVMMAIRPSFTQADRSIIKAIAVINCVVCTILLLCPIWVMRIYIQHISYGGIFIILSALAYLYCSIDSRGHLPATAKAVVLVMATCGLLCTRSKFYGEYVLLWFFLTLYRPGMLRHITPKQIALMTGLTALVILVAWKKINYYFLVGNSGATTFDPETIESFARPVLYATALLIFIDHFPFGTGLASFASFRSAEPYSGVYAEYGIDKVWGLSYTMHDFICDAFYPSLAQFGVVGLVLFIWLWVYIIRLLGNLTKLYGLKARYVYATAMMCVAFVMVESTSGTAMVNSGGVTAMLLLGIIAGRAMEARQTLRSSIHEQSISIS
ncbi:MAG: hypothetical protein NC484_00635 [Alloprevotella sp.]|nr:hypothetical protein [Alloprevotella sp.]